MRGSQRQLTLWLDGAEGTHLALCLPYSALGFRTENAFQKDWSALDARRKEKETSTQGIASKYSGGGLTMGSHWVNVDCMRTFPSTRRPPGFKNFLSWNSVKYYALQFTKNAFSFSTLVSQALHSTEPMS